MALSFEESKKQLAATPMMMSMSRNIDQSIAAYENWEKPSNASLYTYYDNEYYDDKFSIVDENKNITLNSEQINLTQEKNSQYIPFEIPRRYDGFDLSTADISIYWVNKNGNGSVAIPVDVYCSIDKIRFAWLVDDDVTSIAGEIQFEIQARGTNSKGYNYLWKTKSNNGINVIQALEINSFIEPDETWQENFVSRLSEQADRAEIAASEAINAAGAANQVLSDLQDGIANEVQSAIGNNYYTKEDVDNIVSNIDVNLTGYATEEYVQQEVKKIDVSDQLPKKLSDLEEDENHRLVTDTEKQSWNEKSDFSGSYNDLSDKPTAVSFFKNDSGYLTAIPDEYVTDDELAAKGYLTEHQSLDGFATENYVSDKLGDLGINEDGSTKTVVQYVTDSVDAIDVSDQLGDLGKNKDGTDRTVVDYVQNELSNFDLGDYVTLETHNQAVTNINKDITDINTILEGIDNTPNAYYVTTYNEPYTFNGVEYTGENTLVLYKTDELDNKESRYLVSSHVITGGSGGGTSNTIKFEEPMTQSNIAFTVNDDVMIEFVLTATDSDGNDLGQCTSTWKLGDNIIVNKEPISTGYHSIDFTEYFGVGNDQKLTLIITDDIGTVKQKNWYVSVVDIRLESSFSDTNTYEAGKNVNFIYTPYGGIDKVIHFVLDGDVDNEVTQVSTKAAAGRQASYSIPAHAHGAHLLDVYMTAVVNNNNTVESNHIFKDIVWFDNESTVPVIGCATQNINVTQYNTVNVKYTVFDPNTETPEVTWSINGEFSSKEKLTEKDENGYYTYSYKANEAGTFVFTITCGEAEKKTITMNVEKLDIDVSPVTAGIEFDFNPVGYSNSSENRLWSYNNVTMTVSDNFDWVNGGYQLDENGDQYFCVKAGTSAVINYNLFADDPKKNGKEFKAIFRTKNIRKRDTSFLTCMNDGIGLDMKVENATVYNSGGLLKSDYCEDTIIEYEFNINKDTDMMIVMSYEDGTPSKPYEYKETSSFKQTTPQPITIGSEDCDVFIYRMKAYSISLTDTDIKNNFISDARNADEMLARYNRNKIYNDNGSLITTSASGGFNVDALMKAAPDLRYIFLEVPHFTNDKDNKIDGCTVYFRYPAGKRPQDNWTCTGVRHRGQGTSSNLYGYAGRNIDLCMDRDESLFTWNDEDEDGNSITVESSTVTLTDTSVPTDYLNIKTNIASSENANNAEMARRFNEYQPFLRYARKKDSKVKDTMEFYNCVVFIRETSTDSSVPHREFNDTDWHKIA